VLKKYSSTQSQRPSLFSPELEKQARVRWDELSTADKIRSGQVFWLIVSMGTDAAKMRVEFDSLLKPIRKAQWDGVQEMLKQLTPDALHTYHELVVGDILRKLDYEVTYSPKLKTVFAVLNRSDLLEDIGKNTPDWFVKGRSAIEPFIVDVFTAHVPNNQADSLAWIMTLIEKVEQITVDAELALSPTRNNLVIAESLPNTVSQKIKEWLTVEDPDPGAKIVIAASSAEVLYQTTGRLADFDIPPRRDLNHEEVLTFQVLRKNQGRTTVNVIPGPRSFYPSNKTLVNNIKLKVKTYGPANLPLVVAAVADPTTGLSLDELKDIVLGDRTPRAVYGDDGMDILIERASNGLFALHTELSAVLWIARVAGEDWQVTAVQNPAAKYALPESAFRKS